jgi:hypothetical protein
MKITAAPHEHGCREHRREATQPVMRNPKEAEMRTKPLLPLLVAVATAGIAAAPASASGPAAPGKELIQVTCDGLGTIALSVQRGADANGAAQVVDAKGHAIGVEATFTLIDLTTATVLDSETTASGQGNGHPNQPATHCSGVVFRGPASDFFEGNLLPGVAPTDTVQLTVDALAIIKP